MKAPTKCSDCGVTPVPFLLIEDMFAPPRRRRARCHECFHKSLFATGGALCLFCPSKPGQVRRIRLGRKAAAA